MERKTSISYTNAVWVTYSLITSTQSWKEYLEQIRKPQEEYLNFVQFLGEKQKKKNNYFKQPHVKSCSEPKLPRGNLPIMFLLSANASGV